MISLQEMGQRACEAKYSLQKMTAEQKNQALLAAAKALREEAEDILSANREDIAAGEANGMHPGMIDRLRLTKARIDAMAEGLEQIVELEDPIGQVMETFERPNGLVIEKKRVPLGVIGIIYESRPNVTADAFGLCFKTGNAVILKGGSDAIHSNMAITKVLRASLNAVGVTPDAIQLIENTDRSITSAFMKLNDYVDVLIPRGGAGLIRAVVENSTIPVIETGTGNCHVYVDKAADLEMAVKIIMNAKTQRIGVCNACESLVIHEAVREKFLPILANELRSKDVEMRGDEGVRAYLEDCIPATEDDYGKEYLDYIISMKTVSSVDEAIAHINRYGSHHTDSILSTSREHIETFMTLVDSADVFANCSTRFADGFLFGFGAEVGIATGKIHARGPMGMEGLCTYKYRLYGSGQALSELNSGVFSLTHTDLEHKLPE